MLKNQDVVPWGPWPRIGHACAVRALAWSPDGQLLATSDDAGVVLLWRAPFDQPPIRLRSARIRRVRQRLGRGRRPPFRVCLRWRVYMDQMVEGLVFARDGQTLAILVGGGLELHDLSATSPPLVVPGLALPLAQDGQGIWAGVGYGPRKRSGFPDDRMADLVLVDVSTGARLRRVRLEGRREQVGYNLSIHPEHRRVLECRDATITVWDLDTGRLVERLPVDVRALRPEAAEEPPAKAGPSFVSTGPALLSPSGRYVAAVVRSVDPPLLVLLTRPGPDTPAQTSRIDHKCALGPTIEWKTSATADVLNILEGDELRTVNAAARPWIARPVELGGAVERGHPGGVSLVHGARRAIGGGHGEVWVGPRALTHVAATIVALAFGDGVLVSAHADDRVRTWSLTTGELLSVRRAPWGTVRGLDAGGRRAWSVEGRGHADPVLIWVWDTRTGDVIAQAPARPRIHPISVVAGRLAVRVRPEGRSISEGQIQVWSLDEPLPLLEVAVSRSWHMDLALSPDGQRLAYGADDLRVLEIEGGGVHELGEPVPGRGTDTLAWSPDGGRLVAGFGSVIESWNLKEPRGALRMLGLMDGLDLAVTNTGRVAAATAYDPRFCLFEPDGARGVARCGQPGDGRAVVFSEDERWLAVAGGGGTITLWDPDRPSRPRLTLYLLPDGGWASVAPGGAWIGEGVAGYLEGSSGVMDPRGVARVLRDRRT